MEPPGRLEIRDHAVAAIACRAALEVRGVAARAPSLGGLAASRLPSAGVTTAGGVHVDLHVALDWPAPLRVAADVRDAVAARLGALTGLDVRRVDVTVDALVPPERVRAGRVA